MAGVNWSHDQLLTYQRSTYGTQDVSSTNATDPIKNNNNVSTDLQAGLNGKNGGTDIATSSDIYPGTGVERTTTTVPATTSTITPSETPNPEVPTTEVNTSAGRQLYTKEQRNAAIEQAEQEFRQYGTVDGQTNLGDAAAEYAENYVENEYNRENFENTIVFMDKDKYQAAKKDREEQYDALYEQYRSEGLSRKEARRKANAQLPELEYLRKGWFGQRKTRNYIENNRKLFYDENGEFSSEKFRARALEFANTHTDEGEVTNYHLSLRERRAVAQDEGVNASVVKNFAKYSNLSYEKDNTNLYKGLVIGGCTVAGVAAGPLLGSSAAAAAASSSAAAGTAVAGSSASASSSSASSAASASAKTNGYAIGAGLGLGIGLGLASFVKDKGRLEKNIYAPGQPLVLEPVQEETPESPCPLTPIDEEVYEDVPEETCTYTLKRGQTLYDAIRDGYGLTSHKEIMEFVHAIKDRYGLNYNVYTPRTEWEMPEINGKKFNCGVDVRGTCTDFSGRGTERGSFSRNIIRTQTGINYYTEDCDGKRKQYNSKAERDAAVTASQQK